MLDRLIPRSRLMSSFSQQPTLAAFYLPQFHPTAENDEFWGPGFTEWHNVVRARPLFPGHDQPRLPADLGFYDLRLVETQRAQVELAKRYGIGAFCYYHYWFNGNRPLGRPLEQMLATPEVDLPFFLCWANEDWTRTWDGRSQDVLVRQEYSAEDDVAHIRWLLPILSDRRYFRVDGKPILLVYRAALLPDPRLTASRWRAEATREGLGEIHLCAVESFSDERRDPSDIGFDAAVEFQPDWGALADPEGRTRLRQFARTRIGRPSVWFDNAVYSYEQVVDSMIRKPRVSYPRYPCVAPRWDNSPRRTTGAVVIRDSSPDAYERWLTAALQHAANERSPLVFVNAWNEWAEGAYLEPDVSTGHAYLDATAQALNDRRASAPRR